MLNPKNNAAFLRLNVLTAVAKSFIENNFADADKLPEQIVPDGSKALRGSIEKDRLVAKVQAMAAMGFTPCNEEYSKPLSEFAKKAVERTENEPATVSVLPEACNAFFAASSRPPQHGTSIRTMVTDLMSFSRRISVSFSE